MKIVRGNLLILSSVKSTVVGGCKKIFAVAAILITLRQFSVGCWLGVPVPVDESISRLQSVSVPQIPLLRNFLKNNFQGGLLQNNVL